MINCREGDEIIFTWDGADFCWDDNPYCWDDVRLLQQIKTGGYFREYEKLPEEKKERFIILVCKVEGYIPTEERKKVIEANMTAEQVKITVDNILANIKIKNIK